MFKYRFKLELEEFYSYTKPSVEKEDLTTSLFIELVQSLFLIEGIGKYLRSPLTLPFYGEIAPSEIFKSVNLRIMPHLLFVNLQIIPHLLFVTLERVNEETGQGEVIDFISGKEEWIN